ncbi:hypothetical protein B0O99DRAFT_324712 [Bisporella sp. PMI_857]|nr:hypothetical protein B0O99DRAFT_368297 [Bisporella sp. PMI_857]KAH8600418.1 hypothetical protein B0O99DRAFT_324712 [Bisporella sp. PMI_857]
MTNTFLAFAVITLLVTDSAFSRYCNASSSATPSSPTGSCSLATQSLWSLLEPLSILSSCSVKSYSMASLTHGFRALPLKKIINYRNIFITIAHLRSPDTLARMTS